VLELIGGQECVLTAREIAADLRSERGAVAIATVYRTLEALDGLGLVRRLDVGAGQPARYEPAMPGGAEHHHHVLCARCGRAYPFEDAELEKAIAAVANRLEHNVLDHEVTLTGICQGCRQGSASPSRSEAEVVPDPSDGSVRRR
jgi:Fur family ferric uptake transcriptional regulator